MQVHQKGILMSHTMRIGWELKWTRRILHLVLCVAEDRTRIIIYYAQNFPVGAWKPQIRLAFSEEMLEKLRALDGEETKLAQDLVVEVLKREDEVIIDEQTRGSGQTLAHVFGPIFPQIR